MSQKGLSERPQEAGDDEERFSNDAKQRNEDKKGRVETEPRDNPGRGRDIGPENFIHSNSRYTVGWICAIGTEYVAARALLDEEHGGPEYVSRNDNNYYALGKAGRHNVVIAVLPDGEYGTSSAAAVARDLLHTFPNVRIGLMVGIAGGAPSPKYDIRLGDIVVSSAGGGKGGVFQYDFGKQIQGQDFRETGFLNQPPTLLRTVVAGIKAQHEINGHRIEEAISGILEKNPRLRKKYKRPDPSCDILFQSEITHDLACDAGCDINPSNLVVRSERTKWEDNPAIHYGLVASGNQLMNDALFRDKLAKERCVLCFEMEAAGLMNHFPCLVIRGICDYSDSHKSQEWHGYAAMAAAVYAKDLLRQISPNKLEDEVKIVDIISGMSTKIDGIRQFQHEEEHQIALDWLTPIDYAPQQSDFIAQRHNGTGLWLLESVEFKEWMNTDGQTLFCPGIPGSGKTILTSIVVDHLNAQFQNEASVGIAYIYCNFRRKDEQRAEDLLGSLLKQLAQGRSSLSDSLKSLHDRHKVKRTRPSFGEISRALESETALYSRIFIIIDALDECQVADSCRTKILSEITKLQAKGAVNLFATSRFIPDITEKFQDSISREIRASENDVRKYLGDRISQGESRILKRPDMQTEVTAQIAEAVDGMFLLAKLNLDSLLDMKFPKDIRTALKNLPKGSGAYDRAYQDAMDRVESQGPKSVELAKQTLAWITCAKRPLTTNELQHALSVEAGKPELEDNLPQVEDMVSVCAGLVIVDEQSSIIRLVHYTTQEYFDRTQKHWFPNAETDITEVCVTYLSFSAFESGFCRTDEEFEKRLSSYQVYNYAAHNWAYHACKLSHLPEGVIKFLSCKKKLEASTQALFAIKQYSGHLKYTQEFSREMTGLHVAAYFGLRDAVSALLNLGLQPDGLDTYRQTPLSWAARKGNSDVVKLLLETCRVNPIFKNKNGRTPLLLAASNGHEESVRLLLARGGINLEDKVGRTALSLAAELGHQEVVKLLLMDGAVAQNSAKFGGRTPLSWPTDWADPNSRDVSGRTPLWWAAANGQEAVVRLLLAKYYVNPNTKDEYGQSPLTVAVEHNHVRVVELLANDKIDQVSKDITHPSTLRQAMANKHVAVVNQLLADRSVDWDLRRDNWSPLWWAVENGHAITVKILLGIENININLMNSDYRTPLLVAVVNGHEAIVKLLLESGADLEAGDRHNGQTPLSWAARGGRVAIVKLLLEKGAAVNAADDAGRTPLSWACRDKNEVVVKLLLKKGAAIEAKDDFCRTPLLWAVSSGREAVVKLLLENGAAIEAKDSFGRASLSRAAEKGYGSIVELLLGNGAATEDKDNFGRTPLFWSAELQLSRATGSENDAASKQLLEKGNVIDTGDTNARMPLSWAAEKGREAVVKMLLKKGAVIENIDNFGRTPLSLASEKGQICKVNLLLQNGADIHARDDRGQTPLSWAAEKGHEAIVKMILEKGADIEDIDNFGRTPLSWAAEKGHNVVVKLLLEKGAAIEVWDNYCQIFLSWAFDNSYEAVVMLLLESKPDFKVCDSQGRTPLLWAAEKGYEAVVKMLLDKGATIVAWDNYHGRHGRTPLSWATEKGHEAVVKLLLKKGANVNANDRSPGLPLLLAREGGHKSRTPLSWAAENGHQAVIKLLLENGADIEAHDDRGRTPLSWAAENGHEAVVKLLQENCANVEVHDDSGRTPLSWAAGSGHEAVVTMLLNNGADFEAHDDGVQTPLSWAAVNGHLAVVKLLLEEGATMGEAVVELIFERVASTETKNSFSQIALWWAAMNGHEAVVKLLLERGADPNAEYHPLPQQHFFSPESGPMPLSWAAKNGHEAVVKLLLNSGADIEAADENNGQTPLSWAAKNGHEAVVKLLLNSGADIEAADENNGQTPLSWAAVNGHEAVVKLLLNNGADIEAADKTYGQTPLSWAAANGHEAVVKLLLNSGANIEAADNIYGWTPLSWAARRRHEAVVKLLIENGAAVEAEDDISQAHYSGLPRMGGIWRAL